MKAPLHKNRIRSASGMILVILVPLELAMCWTGSPSSLPEVLGNAARGLRILLPTPEPQPIVAMSPQSPEPVIAPPAAPEIGTVPEQARFETALVSTAASTVPPPQLSPDGQFAAGLVLDQIGGYRGTLVVFRVSDRAEISRHHVTDGAMNHLWWTPQGNELMGWQSFVDVPPSVGFQSDGANARKSSVDPEGDTSVLFDASGVLGAIRISTQQPVPLGYDWHPVGNLPSLALLPTPRGQKSTDVQAVLSERWGEPNPTPIPTPPPTPKPLTPEQRKFQIKDDRQAEELSALSERFQTAQNLSNAEKKRLIARANAINKFDVEGRARLFPPQPRAEKILGPEDYSRVQLRDLSTGRLIWTRKTSSTWMPPHPCFSPDGSVLLLMGLPRAMKPEDGHDAGVEVLDSQTGITKFRLKMGGGDFDNSQTLRFFNAGHPMIAYTRDGEQDTFLYLVDLADGHQVAKWPLAELKSLGISSLRGFSCDAKGETWSFSVDTGEGWKIFTREQLEAPGKT